jgi:hypothetical protein
VNDRYHVSKGNWLILLKNSDNRFINREKNLLFINKGKWTDRIKNIRYLKKKDIKEKDIRNNIWRERILRNKKISNKHTVKDPENKETKKKYK